MCFAGAWVCPSWALDQADWHSEKSANASQILGRVDAPPWRMCRDMHGNSFAVPKNPQLLQRFNGFQWADRQLWEPPQEACSVSVNADVPQWSARTAGRLWRARGIAPPWDRCA